jgi:alpha-1,6-mannosyltransferase
MTAAGVVVLAGQHRVSGALALTLGVTSPLVLLHMLGGSHNDSLMLGFAVLGLAAFQSGRRVLAVALLVLAVGIKLPVALALGFVGWCWHRGSEVGFWTRVRTAATVVLASAAAIVALCSVVGIGFGWVTALKDTGKITSTFSATTKLGFIAGDVARLVGVDAAPDAYVGIARTLGLLAAVAVTAVLLLRSPRVGLVPSLGLALTAVMLLGPVLWPWYLPAGFALLAASGIDRFRPTYVVLVVAATWTVWPTSVDPVTGFESWSHILGFLAIAGIALACFLAQVVSARAAAWWTARTPRHDDVVVDLSRA